MIAGHGEDPRYRAMRRHWGARFPWISLATVFALQGLLQGLVSLPLQVGIAAPGAAPLGALDALGATLFAAGLGFETLGDLQLARFKADPANAGRVMDRGLWRYTRHPNDQRRTSAFLPMPPRGRRRRASVPPAR